MLPTPSSGGQEPRVQGAAAALLFVRSALLMASGGASPSLRTGLGDHTNTVRASGGRPAPGARGRVRSSRSAGDLDWGPGDSHTEGGRYREWTRCD